MTHGTTQGYQYHKCRCVLCKKAKSVEGKKYWLKTRIVHRNAAIQRLYGISSEEYEELLIVQNGVCAICDKPELSGNRLAIDHCHRTGFVRGLLCVGCNRKLGWFEVLEKEIYQYLKPFRS